MTAVSSMTAPTMPTMLDAVSGSPAKKATMRMTTPAPPRISRSLFPTFCLNIGIILSFVGIYYRGKGTSIQRPLFMLSDYPCVIMGRTIYVMSD
jgi:hypothetical protein